jgi:DNA (cytosine-5)-methyltransferase 1
MTTTARHSEAVPGAGDFSFLDLFAGAGGLSLGLQAAGFEPVGAVEILDDAARTYEGLHDLEVDRRKLEDIPERELRAYRGRVAVIAGGPPCQPWSTGGLRRGDDDERDGFTAMFRALDLIRPEAFVIENVAGLGRGSTQAYFQALIEVLIELGYHVSTRTLDAADFGVPQHRLRLFIVGMEKAGFKFPRPTHGPKARSPWVTAGQVLTDEPVGEPNSSIVTYAKKPHLRPSPYDGLLFNGGGRPINLGAPARTILASAGGNKTPFIDTLGVVPGYHEELWEHFQKHGEAGLDRIIRIGLVPGARRITVSESAALQSFPLDLAFSGRPSKQYTLVGNAVPPLLAAAVGRALRSALKRLRAT